MERTASTSLGKKKNNPYLVNPLCGTFPSLGIFGGEKMEGLWGVVPHVGKGLENRLSGAWFQQPKCFGKKTRLQHETDKESFYNRGGGRFVHLHP